MNQASIARVLNSCTKTFTGKDFFGIAHITTKDIAGKVVGTKLPKDKLDAKYIPLIQKRSRKANEESEVDVTFGKLRFDEDNAPRNHGQFEPSNEDLLFNTVDIKQRYVPVQSEEERNRDEPTEVTDAESEEPAIKVNDVTASVDFEEILNLFKRTVDIKQEISKSSNAPPLKFDFESVLSKDKTPLEKCPQRLEMPTQLPGPKTDDFEPRDTRPEARIEADDPQPSLDYDSETEELTNEELDFRQFKKTLEDSNLFDKELDAKYEPKNDKPEPSMSALEYLKNIRAQRLKPVDDNLKRRVETNNPYSFRPSLRLDSQGFYNYTNQVPNWSAVRHVDILNYLKSSILYHNYDILAVNKPYGIASHDEERSREPFDMNNLMQEIASSMKIEKVYLAHRLDKTTTGILLFTTSQERAAQINKLFKSDQINKTYWCITKGVPSPKRAVIDMPIGEYTVAGKVRSCVVPETWSQHKQLSKRYREARRAITEYTVLNSKDHCALVEVKPKTGVKHQIRCHMSFGMGKPILGDHKYSSVGKIAPQELPAQLLKDFHIRQSKVRTLPMHLHAKSIVIPGVKANGETLFIHAPLPAHFKANLKTLKLANYEIRQTASKI